MMKTFKNVVEGMGLGILSDTVLAGMKVGFRKTQGATTGKFKGSKPLDEMTVPQANERSRQIQKIKQVIFKLMEVNKTEQD